MTDLVKHRNFVDDCDGLGVDGMCNGTVHAMFSGGWDEDYLREAMGDNLACAVLPSFTVGGRTYQMRSFLGTKAIGVNPNAADIRAAMDLAAYMASPEAQQLHYQLGGVSPVAEACSQDPAVRADQSVAVEISQTEYAVVQPVIPEMLAYWDPMRQFGLEILNGSVTKKNASYSLNSVMEEINSR
jgi:arabinogalactan oligomer/maltooligosaccharide transport system substrate-binding protein